jgi:hypothetical protein
LHSKWQATFCDDPRWENEGPAARIARLAPCGENHTLSPDQRVTQAIANYLRREMASQGLA